MYNVIIIIYILLYNKVMEEYNIINKDINYNILNNVEYVVAHYNKKIDWILDNKINDKTIIYNKSNANIKNEFKNVINLNNVGRESHTYIYHIIKNYDNLAEITFFTQDNPFDHCTDYIIRMKEIYLNKNIFFYGFGNRNIRVQNYICKHHDNIPIKKLCDELCLNTNGNFTFTPGAIIMVRKSAILKHNIDFYKKCLSYLEYNIDPIEGYVFERIWGVIFGEV
jgi:hypothetical protein